MNTRLVASLLVALAASTAVAEEISGTVELDGSSPTYSGLTGSGTLKNSSATLSVVTVDASGDATFDGVLTGNIRLVKRGSGVQTISRENKDYTGGTLVEGGVLAASSIDSIGAKGIMAAGGYPERMITVRNGAVLRVTTTGTEGNPSYMSQGVAVPSGETGVLEITGWMTKDGSLIQLY